MKSRKIQNHSQWESSKMCLQDLILDYSAAIDEADIEEIIGCTGAAGDPMYCPRANEIDKAFRKNNFYLITQMVIELSLVMEIYFDKEKALPLLDMAMSTLPENVVYKRTGFFYRENLTCRNRLLQRKNDLIDQDKIDAAANGTPCQPKYPTS